MIDQPYAHAAALYFDAGWLSVLPLPPKQKAPVPTGYTGWSGEVPSWADIQSWIETKPGGNVALRMPNSVLGIDVDSYENKTGIETLLACEAKWGKLPATWVSSARGDTGSGIHFYRVPAGLSWPGELPGGSVELIHSGHRYAVVWPSVHPKIGKPYEWFAGAVKPRAGAVPSIEDLPMLPGGWIAGLSRGAHVDEPKADMSSAETNGWIEAHGNGSPCVEMARIAGRVALQFGASGSRHESLSGLLHVVRAMESGHVGGQNALADLRRLFVASVSNDRTGASGEFDRSLAGAIALVKGSPELAAGTAGDPCLLRQDVAVTLDGFKSSDDDAPAVDPRVAIELDRMRIRDEARKLYDTERGQQVTMPEMIGLGDLLAQPDEQVQYRVQGLWRMEGKALIVAQFKAGKTTLVGNLIRSLVDGKQFLDYFTVQPVSRPIVLIDDEMNLSLLRKWLRGQNIENHHMVKLYTLRGRVSSFDLMNEETRSRWVKVIKEIDAEIIIFDCLRPVLDALGLSEDKDSGRFLVAFDALVLESGASESVVVHHMGHGGTRSRGDSRIVDWPDVEWRLTRPGENGNEANPSAPRYFSAYGRDVEVDEGSLTLTGRHLTYTPGEDRKAAKDEAQRTAQMSAEASARLAVCNYLREVGEGSMRDIEANCFRGGMGVTKTEFRGVVDRMIGSTIAVDRPAGSVKYNRGQRYRLAEMVESERQIDLDLDRC